MKCLLLFLLSLSAFGQTTDYCPDIYDAATPKINYAKAGSFKAAVAALPSTGGVIEVPFGSYANCDALNYVTAASKKNIALVGVLDASGNRPTFSCSLSAPQPVFFSAGWYSGTIASPYAPSPQRFEIKNIEVMNYSGVFNGANYASVTVVNNHFHGAAGNGLMDGDAYGDQSRERRVCGNELDHLGQGNTMHGVYWHRNTANNQTGTGTAGKGTTASYFVDNRCHDMRGSHCYKSTSEFNYVAGNRFDTNLDGDPRFYGSELVDIMSCGNSVVRDNTFNAYSPNREIIYFTNRQDSTGCDRPVYGSGQFLDAAFWASIVNAGVSDALPNPPSVANAGLFHHFVSGNKFTELRPNTVRALKSPSYAVGHYGTVPNKVPYAFGTCHSDPGTPSFWIERSRVWMANNSYAGNIGAVRYDQNQPEWCSNPPPPVAVNAPIIAVGGEDGTPITLPVWFKR